MSKISAAERAVTWTTKIQVVSFELSCLIYNWLSAFSHKYHNCQSTSTKNFIRTKYSRLSRRV